MNEGTNDILLTLDPDADKAAGRMDVFLNWLLSEDDHPYILMIAPPYIDGAFKKSENNTSDKYSKVTAPALYADVPLEDKEYLSFAPD